jgi:hypothetical protein
MRTLFAIAAIVAAAASFDGARNAAQADPYPWCAQYGSRGVTNCYFRTWGQCLAAISGNGGFCVPNNFYDGRPVVTPEDGPRRFRVR